MKDKATKSLTAAQRLINTRETFGYNSSVHCSYYAVFQYMKYVLANTNRSCIPYTKQDVRGVGSHNYILNEIVNRIDNYKDSRSFKDAVKWLKSERKDADYTSRNFTLNDSLSCKERATNIISKLNQYFGL